jgi:hypothetical protein
MMQKEWISAGIIVKGNSKSFYVGNIKMESNNLMEALNEYALFTSTTLTPSSSVRNECLVAK